MKRFLKWIIALLVTALLVVLAVRAFMEGRREAAVEAEREKPFKAPTRVETVNGENVVTLDRATQTNSGVALAPLETISHRRQIPAYGVVVDLDELTDLCNAIETAQAQLSKARAARDVARKEYERVTALYQKNQDVSQKVVQAAEGTLQAEESNLQAAHAALNTAQATALQHWGSVIAKWLAQAAPEWQCLRSQKTMLVQVTLAPGQAVITTPQTALVQAAGGRLGSATFVSAAPRTDPKIQGKSFFYVLPADSTDLLPGMNVTALLPVGDPATGMVVPASAVVWLQGKAWAYAQINPDHFARREVSTEQPVQGGWFEPQSFSMGHLFVVKGPQVLLSEEFRAQISVGEEGK